MEGQGTSNKNNVGNIVDLLLQDLVHSDEDEDDSDDDDDIPLDDGDDDIPLDDGQFSVVYHKVLLCVNLFFSKH